ncbi:MAG: hypothetical protein E1N59_2957 [Puniceicoccaceae bacterium 5H]|nr:MAG: hypothetical protein E1N59_2957 [Puniceicoccaceae bacterium 5H]
MTFREANPADATAIAALARKTYAETFGHMDPDDLAAELEATKSTAYFHHSMRERDTFILAEATGRLTGYVGIGRCHILRDGRVIDEDLVMLRS